MNAPESKVAAPVGGHTPPWRIVEREVLEDGSVYPRHIADASGNCVAYLEASSVAALAIKEPGSLWDTSEAKETRARLIAAAPELLEALMQAQSLFQQINRDDGDEFKNLSCDGLDLLEPLIARATGAAS